MFNLKKKILLFSNANNCLTQRFALELRERKNLVNIQLAFNEIEMVHAFKKLNPDIVICPFLTRKIPAEIYSNPQPCIIVHPGIKGDRGISSLDWAIHNQQSEWGVTLLQAVEEMDAGPIWSSKNFKVPIDSTKSLLYRTKVVDYAVQGLFEFLDKYEKGISPEPLDYTKPDVKGTLNPRMRDEIRYVDWDESINEILKKIRCSDSIPGAIGVINSVKYRMFNPYVDEKMLKISGYNNLRIGDIVSKKHGAICIKTKEAPLWISHLKKENGIKLPADYFINDGIPTIKEDNLFVEETPKTFQEIYIKIRDEVAFLHFNFLNGAMNTSQCLRLQRAIDILSNRDDIKIIVLRGGQDFFSNGINLNTIEASSDPIQESNKNILAINACIRSMFSITNKITIAYLEGNAGAGGAMMPLAADYVYAKSGVVLNPHYKSMGLYGSEYWTYWLTKRVGEKLALELTENCHPVLARTLVNSGLIDCIIDNETQLDQQIENLLRQYPSLIEKKQAERTDAWFNKLENNKLQELQRMKENFIHSDYHRARKNFVFKTCIRNMAATSVIQDIPISRTIDCLKFVEHKIKTFVQPKIHEIKAKYNIKPHLRIINVGFHPESEIYIKKKKETFESNGFKVTVDHIDAGKFKPHEVENITISHITSANQDDTVHGILVQLPLPSEISTSKVLEAINPNKDIDGLSMVNFGKLSLSNFAKGDMIMPCTIRGISELFDFYDIKIQGRDIVIIGKGITSGLPISLYMMSQGATVTVCDLHTTNLKEKISKAQIVISAANGTNVIQPEWISQNTIVIDVGTKIIVDEQGKIKIRGNLSNKKIEKGFRTPVPGGIGSVTVLAAMQNTLDAFYKSIELSKSTNTNKIINISREWILQFQV